MGAYEDRLYRKFIDKVIEFESKHERAFLPEKRNMIIYLYRRLKFESDEAIYGVKYDSETIKIKIVCNEFFDLEEIGTFLKLLSLCSSIVIKKKKRKIEIVLGFRTWKWVEK